MRDEISEGKEEREGEGRKSWLLQREEGGGGGKD